MKLKRATTAEFTSISPILYIGHLQVVVADFEERQCPVGHDGQERSRDNAHHCTRNAICKLLGTGFYSF